MLPETLLNNTHTDAAMVKVPFILARPHARTVWLAVFFRNWPPQSPPASSRWRVREYQGPQLVRELVRMSEAKPGLWRCAVSLRPGWCEYLFLVDGEWVLDPSAPEKCPDGAGDFSSARRIESVSPAEAFPAQPVRGASRRHNDTVRQSAA